MSGWVPVGTVEAFMRASSPEAEIQALPWDRDRGPDSLIRSIFAVLTSMGGVLRGAGGNVGSALGAAYASILIFLPLGLVVAFGIRATRDEFATFLRTLGSPVWRAVAAGYGREQSPAILIGSMVVAVAIGPVFLLLWGYLSGFLYRMLGASTPVSQSATALVWVVAASVPLTHALNLLILGAGAVTAPAMGHLLVVFPIWQLPLHAALISNATGVGLWRVVAGGIITTVAFMVLFFVLGLLIAVAGVAMRAR